MKKTLSLILAVMMLLGCMSITAFAADNEATISAEITAADFGYTMVIPTSTTLTEAKHENVLLGTTAAADGDGIVSIKDIKHATDKVNVYYTVDLTNGDLTDGTNTIAATYKYKQGENAFAAIDGTTKVTVYANKTVTNSLVNVTADDTQWKAAPTGTYNATVTFNFAQEKMIRTIEDVLATVENFPSSSLISGYPPATAWVNSEAERYAFIRPETSGFGLSLQRIDSTVSTYCPSLDTSVTAAENSTYVAIDPDDSNVTYTFNMKDNVLESFTVSGSYNGFVDGTYIAPAN